MSRYDRDSNQIYTSCQPALFIIVSGCVRHSLSATPVHSPCYFSVELVGTLSRQCPLPVLQMLCWDDGAECLFELLTCCQHNRTMVLHGPECAISRRIMDSRSCLHALCGMRGTPLKHTQLCGATTWWSCQLSHCTRGSTWGDRGALSVDCAWTWRARYGRWCLWQPKWKVSPSAEAFMRVLHRRG